MPLFYFDVLHRSSPLDEEGTELPDMYTAQQQAVILAGEILRDMGTKFWNNGEWRLQVSNEDRQPLFVLKFSAEERVYMEPPPAPASGPLID